MWLRKKRPNQFVSIDCGSSTLKIFFGMPSARGFKNVRYAAKDIKISDPSQKETASAFIKEFLKTNKISSQDVYMTLSGDESLITKYLALPLMPKKEIFNAIQWEIKEDPEIDLTRSIYDWDIVNEFTEADGAKKQRVLLVVVSSENLNKYLSVLKECRLRPWIITPDSFCYLNVLDNSHKRGKTEVVLDIGNHETAVHIYFNRKLNYSMRFAFSKEKLVHSLTGTFFANQNKVALSNEEAKQLIEEHGVPLDESAILKDNISSGLFLALMRPLLESLVRDLRYSFNGFISHSAGAEGPSILYVTGEGATIKNIDKYLTTALSIPTEFLSYSGAVDLAIGHGEHWEKDKYSLMAALGACLGDFQGMNLLPLEIKMETVENIQKAFLRLSALAMVTATLAIFFLTGLQMANYEKRSVSTKKYLSAFSAFSDLTPKVMPFQNLNQQIWLDKVTAESVLKVVAMLVPAGVILEEMTLDQSSQILILKGKVPPSKDGVIPDLLTGLVRKIKTSHYFSYTELVSSSDKKDGKVFEIRCKLGF